MRTYIKILVAISGALMFCQITYASSVVITPDVVKAWQAEMLACCDSPDTETPTSAQPIVLLTTPTTTVATTTNPNHHDRLENRYDIYVTNSSQKLVTLHYRSRLDHSIPPSDWYTIPIVTHPEIVYNEFENLKVKSITLHYRSGADHYIPIYDWSSVDVPQYMKVLFRQEDVGLVKSIDIEVYTNTDIATKNSTINVVETPHATSAAIYYVASEATDSVPITIPIVASNPTLIAKTITEMTTISTPTTTPTSKIQFEPMTYSTSNKIVETTTHGQIENNNVVIVATTTSGNRPQVTSSSIQLIETKTNSNTSFLVSISNFLKHIFGF